MVGTGLRPCQMSGTVASNAKPPASAGKVFQLLVLCSHIPGFYLPSLFYPFIIYSFHLFFYCCVVYFLFVLL